MRCVAYPCQPFKIPCVVNDMNATQELADEMAEVAAFCIEHRGDCFKRWPKGTLWPDSAVFRYLAGQYLSGNLYIARRAGAVVGVIVVWVDGDSNLQVREVIGDRDSCRSLWKTHKDRFDGFKKAFTWRLIRGLPSKVEIPITRLARFMNFNVTDSIKEAYGRRA